MEVARLCANNNNNATEAFSQAKEPVVCSGKQEFIGENNIIPRSEREEHIQSAVVD